jgi:hypothetical protein
MLYGYSCHLPQFLAESRTCSHPLAISAQTRKLWLANVLRLSVAGESHVYGTEG